MNVVIDCCNGWIAGCLIYDMLVYLVNNECGPPFGELYAILIVLLEFRNNGL